MLAKYLYSYLLLLLVMELSVFSWLHRYYSRRIQSLTPLSRHRGTFADPPRASISWECFLKVIAFVLRWMLPWVPRYFYQKTSFRSASLLRLRSIAPLCTLVYPIFQDSQMRTFAFGISLSSDYNVIRILSYRLSLTWAWGIREFALRCSLLIVLVSYKKNPDHHHSKSGFMSLARYGKYIDTSWKIKFSWRWIWEKYIYFSGEIKSGFDRVFQIMAGEHIVMRGIHFHSLLNTLYS